MSSRRLCMAILSANKALLWFWLAISFYLCHCFWLGVHGPYFLNKRLFPNTVFTLNMEMFLKSEIVLMEKKMRRALLGKLNSVNDIYILRKNLGRRSSCPDHFSVLEISFTYIHTYRHTYIHNLVGESALLSPHTHSLSALFFTLILSLTTL